MRSSEEDYAAWPERIKLPARQVAALFYSLTGKGLTVVLEQRAIRGVDPRESLMLAMGNGYFFSNLPVGSRLDFRTIRETDVGIVSNELTDQQIDAIWRQMGATANETVGLTATPQTATPPR